MSNTKRKITAFGAAVLLFTALSAEAQSRRQNKDKPEEETSISILDSTDAQWGMRSVNDSVYQGYPMNAVYLERGRTKLPANFPKYTPKPLGNDMVVRSSDSKSGTTIRVNGVVTPLEKSE